MGSVDFFLERLRQQMADTGSGHSAVQPTWDKKFDLKPSSDLNSRFPKRTDWKITSTYRRGTEQSVDSKDERCSTQAKYDDAKEAQMKRSNIAGQAKVTRDGFSSKVGSSRQGGDTIFRVRTSVRICSFFINSDFTLKPHARQNLSILPRRLQHGDGQSPRRQKGLSQGS